MSARSVYVSDSHRFNEKVQRVDDWFIKPRPTCIEELFLSERNEIPEIRNFLGHFFSLRFENIGPWKNSVESILPFSCTDDFLRNEHSYENHCGRLLALSTFLGLGDLHNENVIICELEGEIVPVPIDLEIILWNCISGMDTLLYPSSIVESKNAGFTGQFVAPYTPNHPENILKSFIEHSLNLWPLLKGLSTKIDCHFKEKPIRVLLRQTQFYYNLLRNKPNKMSTPLLESEKIQIQAGDIPYFFIKRSERGKLFFFPKPNIIESSPFVGFEKAVSSANLPISMFYKYERFSRLFDITCLQIIRSYLHSFTVRKKSFHSFSYEITDELISVEGDSFKIRAKAL